MIRGCAGCGKEVQANWTSCPYCSNSLLSTVAQFNHPQLPVEQNLSVQLVKKRFFPTVKLTVIFRDPIYGLNEQISFGTMARTYTAKLTNGAKIGTLPLQGITVFSGAQGMISFPSGHTYNVVLMTGTFGPKGITITDWNDGRKCMITF
tara:strand:- start:376 stop:822 length:447 start_codon:yes stop_codon:yes gene_type:complete